VAGARYRAGQVGVGTRWRRGLDSRASVKGGGARADTRGAVRLVGPMNLNIDELVSLLKI
jgi:hypothetical protein